MDLIPKQDVAGGINFSSVPLTQRKVMRKENKNATEK